MDLKKQPKELSRILALDLATNTGWATYDKKKFKFGTVDLSNGQHAGAGMRFLKFQNWLQNLKPFDLLVYESVHGHSSTYASHIYGGYLSILQAYCEETETPYQGYGVTTIKKFFTGKGSASKDAMIKEARLRGHNVADDNQADALGILYLGMDEFKSLLIQP
jgi:Holliday junction resolvasome RuvABC endonuclease subunit